MIRREQAREAAAVVGIGDAEFDDMWANFRLLVTLIEAEGKRRGLDRQSAAFTHFGSMAIINDSRTRH